MEERKLSIRACIQRTRPSHNINMIHAVKLTRAEFVGASVLLRSLLVKRMASIKTRPHMRSMGTMPLYIYLLPLHLSGDRKDVNE